MSMYDWHVIAGDLNAEELAKVAEFSAQLVTAEGHEAELALVKQALATLLDSPERDDMAHFLGTVTYLAKHGSREERDAAIAVGQLVAQAGPAIDSEKTAANTNMIPSGPPGFPADDRYVSAGTAKGPLFYGTLMAAAAPFMLHTSHARRRRKAVGDSINTILGEHPELRDDPHAHRYFDVISSFAPDVAANPMLAGNVMKSLHQVGPGSVTPKVIKELIDFQEAHQKNTGIQAETLRNFAMVAGGLAKKP